MPSSTPRRARRRLAASARCSDCPQTHARPQRQAPQAPQRAPRTHLHPPCDARTRLSPPLSPLQTQARTRLSRRCRCSGSWRPSCRRHAPPRSAPRRGSQRGAPASRERRPTLPAARPRVRPRARGSRRCRRRCGCCRNCSSPQARRRSRRRTMGTAEDTGCVLLGWDGHLQEGARQHGVHAGHRRVTRCRSRCQHESNPPSPRAYVRRAWDRMCATLCLLGIPQGDTYTS
mmetsp:Transcript_34420/g.94880  ORF Transcript_34420/g.94880 Transcript_34420/m.94880 type:complete len:231 (-) Transcript_34420:146-838(-)